MPLQFQSCRSGLILCLAVFCMSPFSWARETQWLEVRSPHFSVVTDAGEKRGREVAVKFEQMRAVFAVLLTKAKVNLPVPLQIVAFRNTQEMRQFAPLWNGKPTKVAGLFQGGEDRSFILLDMSVEDPFTVVFHEYAHQLLNGNVRGRTPPWFDEGFAEYFSTIEVEGKHAKVGAKPPPGDWETLQQHDLMKVSDLFRVRQDMQIYNEGDRRSLFYAQSWLVVHYLYDKQQISKAFDYFSMVLSGQMAVDDAIQKAFGMTPAEFDKTLQKYLSAGQVRYVRMNTPPGIETTGYTVTAVNAGDAQAVLADVHLHSPFYQEKALQEFEEILKTQPENAAALRGLGYAYLRKGDIHRAGDYFEKAAKQNSRDPRVHYYTAMLMNRTQEHGSHADRSTAMKKELQTAIELDPNFADAYGLLALAYQFAGEREQAIEAAKKAVDLSPRNENFLFNLAMIYLSGGKRDEAASVLNVLQNSPNPMIAARARDSLAQLHQMREREDSGGEIVLRREGREAASKERMGAEKQATEKQGPTTATGTVSAAPVRFLKGKLVQVDCSANPVAVMTVVSGGKTWRMKVANTKRVIVIGADEFSCTWTNQKVAVNYREVAEGEGSVMSVEIQ